MKIKKVASICKHRKRVDIYCAADGTQFLSDGTAAYAAFDMPELGEESILAIFDVKKDDRPKWDVRILGLPEGISFADVVPGEKLVERYPFPIVNSGRVLFPIMTTGGVIFVDNEYLAPLDDAPFGIELYERRGGASTYIAVKAGMTLLGVILPEPVINKTFVELLSALTNACAYRLQEAQASQEQDGDDDQYGFEEVESHETD